MKKNVTSNKKGKKISKKTKKSTKKEKLSEPLPQQSIKEETPIVKRNWLLYYNSFRRVSSIYLKEQGKKPTNEELNNLWREKKQEIKKYVSKNNIGVINFEEHYAITLLEEPPVIEESYIIPDLDNFFVDFGLFEWYRINDLVSDKRYNYFNPQDIIKLDLSDIEKPEEYSSRQDNFADWYSVEIYGGLNRDFRSTNARYNKSPVPEFIIDRDHIIINEKERFNTYIFKITVSEDISKKSDEIMSPKVKDVISPVTEDKEIIIEKERTKQGEIRLKERDQINEMFRDLDKRFDKGLISKKQYKETYDTLNKQLKNLK